MAPCLPLAWGCYMPVNIFNQAAYEDDIAAIAPGLNSLPSRKQLPKRFKLLTLADILQRHPASWLIKNVAPRQGIMAVFGPSGSGKTFLVISLVAAISQGSNWFGLRVTKAPVIYIPLEGVHGIAQRFKAHVSEIGPLGDLHLIESELNLVNVNDESALVDVIADAGLEDPVIVIDTLAQATVGMDENSGEDMGRVIAVCKRIQEKTNGLVILLHHTGKDSARGMRGHSSLIGALDAAIEVVGGSDGAPRQWIARKVKDGESGKAFPFNLRRVVLGYDNDGDEISSCVIEPTDEACKAVRSARIPSGGNQRLVWDALGDLLKHSKHFGMAGSPPTRPCLQLSAAIDQLRDRLPCDPKRRAERTREAITGLINRGLISLRDDWLWIS